MSIYTTDLQALYVAYFNRPGDVSGMAYWESALTKGATLATVSASFAGTAEYKASFAGKSNDQIVAQIYQNLFAVKLSQLACCGGARL